MFRMKVREEASRQGLSQGKLSRIADVDINTVRKIYRYPSTSITLDVLDRLAVALQVDISELLESVYNNQEK